MEALEDLIKAEVNIKTLKIVNNEESGLVKRVRADFKNSAPNLAKIMKQLGKVLSEMSQKDILCL